MSIKDLNDAELLDVIVEGSGPKKRNVKNQFVDMFIRKYQIQRGEVKVPNHVIYYVYIKSGMAVGDARVGKSAFFRHFNSEFQRYRNGRQRYYLISWDVEVTKELMESAKRYDLRWESQNKRRRDEKAE